MFESSARSLPAQLQADPLRRQARDLLRQWRAGDPQALNRVAAWPVGARPPLPRLASAQRIVARELGCADWSELMAAVVQQHSRTLDDLGFAAHVLDAAIGRGWSRPQPQVARDRLASRRSVALSVPGGVALALAAGELDRLSGWPGASASPRWVNEPLPPWQAPPLAYAAFSSLAGLPSHHEALVATVRWLLARGADPNATLRDPAYPDNPMPVLYGAVARAACAETARALLEAGADPNDGESLYHAVEQKDRQLVALLVAAGALWTGTNALHRQLDFPDLEGLALALSLGADPNEPRAGGIRPLHHAVMRGRGLPAVKCLVQAGADPSARDDDGRSAADWAALTGDTATLDYLSTLGVTPPADLRSRFLAACAAGDEAVARELLARQPDLVATLDAAGLRLLPDHAQHGRLAAVRLMLEIGWPVDTPGDWDASALNQAAFRGDAPMVALLLSRGAHWEERNGFGGTALGSCLHAAAHEPEPGGDYAAVLKMLLAQGATVSPDDEALPDALLDVVLSWHDGSTEGDGPASSGSSTVNP